MKFVSWRTCSHSYPRDDYTNLSLIYSSFIGYPMDAIATHTVTKQRWKVGLCLFGLGFMGILSLLAADLPLQNLPPALHDRFTPVQLKLLVLINPTLLLLVTVLVGTTLYPKTTLRLWWPRSPSWRNDGVVPGVVAGLSILLVTAGFNLVIPQELRHLGEANQLGILPRFLYGGITEEILLRFGLMTLFVWLITGVMGYRRPIGYWVAISLAAVLFGAGHLPALYGLVKNPSASLTLYIIIGNSVGGLVFGWVYWRKSLGMAMVAHAMAHVVLLASEWLSRLI